MAVNPLTPCELVGLVLLVRQLNFVTLPYSVVIGNDYYVGSHFTDWVVFKIYCFGFRIDLMPPDIRIEKHVFE